ncbi:MAG TPA: hypothetical protein VF081_10875 [Solirubrobacterales bacterium]
MNGRRAIVGLCMLCALLTSAFAAQSASAITGTTAFTCVKGAKPEDRKGEHCLEIEPLIANKEYGHVPIAQDTTTELTGTNEKTEEGTTAASTGRLRLTIAGVPLELGATGVDGSGWMENKVAASGEHYAHGKGTITFTGVKVTKPEGRGCKVFTDSDLGVKGEEGVVHTRELTATTELQKAGEPHFLNFKAADGGNFANFYVECEEGKKIPAIEGTWSCSGSVKGQPNGATTVFTHATVTTENLLKCKGTKSGIEGKLTLSSRAKGSGGAFTPLAATTVAT